MNTETILAVAAVGSCVAAFFSVIVAVLMFLQNKKIAKNHEDALKEIAELQTKTQKELAENIGTLISSRMGNAARQISNTIQSESSLSRGYRR